MKQITQIFSEGESPTLKLLIIQNMNEICDVMVSTDNDKRSSFGYIF